MEKKTVHHPFLFGISHYEPSSELGVPHIAGNHHLTTMIQLCNHVIKL